MNSVVCCMCGGEVAQQLSPDARQSENICGPKGRPGRVKLGSQNRGADLQTGWRGKEVGEVGEREGHRFPFEPRCSVRGWGGMLPAAVTGKVSLRTTLVSHCSRSPQHFSFTVSLSQGAARWKRGKRGIFGCSVRILVRFGAGVGLEPR